MSETLNLLESRVIENPGREPLRYYGCAPDLRSEDCLFTDATLAAFFQDAVQEFRSRLPALICYRLALLERSRGRAGAPVEEWRERAYGVGPTFTPPERARLWPTGLAAVLIAAQDAARDAPLPLYVLGDRVLDTATQRGATVVKVTEAGDPEGSPAGRRYLLHIDGLPKIPPEMGGFWRREGQLQPESSGVAGPDERVEQVAGLLREYVPEWKQEDGDDTITAVAAELVTAARPFRVYRPMRSDGWYVAETGGDAPVGDPDLPIDWEPIPRESLALNFALPFTQADALAASLNRMLGLGAAE